MKTVEINSANGKYLTNIMLNGLQKKPLKECIHHASRVVVITARPISKHYLEPLKQALGERHAEDPIATYLIPDGEAAKSLDQYTSIIDYLIQHQHDRETLLIALGGGVITDLTGFVASTFHRGIPYISIPTTLLAQVDACIGGKTAINHPRGKNLIGSFYPPQQVFIDPTTLNTLPERTFRAGIAEMIKIALVADADFFDWLEKHLSRILARAPNTLEEAIFRACRLKADIVSADEKEQGRRVLLNLGHTFAHALEKQLGYGTWHHGEAVASGIWMAAQLSQSLLGLPQTDCQRIQDILKKSLLLNRLPGNLDLDTLVQLMRNDKKSRNTRLFLVLLKGVGVGQVSGDVSTTAIKHSVRDYQTFSEV